MIDKMYWITGEVLSVGAQLAEAPNLPSADVMKRRIGTLLDDMERRGTEVGIQKRDLDDAKYAIVAFLDEQLFRARWAGRQEWMLEPLQLTYFNENTAGEGFYTRLEALERDPARIHVLEVYYLCLALGFQGKYAVRGGDGLAALSDRVVGILARATRGDQLSPHDVPPDAGKGGARREVPVLIIGGAVVGLAILLAIILKVVLAASTSDTAKHLSASTQQATSAKK